MTMLGCARKRRWLVPIQQQQQFQQYQVVMIPKLLLCRQIQHLSHCNYDRSSSSDRSFSRVRNRTYFHDTSHYRILTQQQQRQRYQMFSTTTSPSTSSSSSSSSSVSSQNNTNNSSDDRSGHMDSIDDDKHFPHPPTDGNYDDHHHHNDHVESNDTSATRPNEAIGVVDSTSSSELSSSWYKDAVSDENYDESRAQQEQRLLDRDSNSVATTTFDRPFSPTGGTTNPNSNTTTNITIKPWLDIHRPLHVRIHEILESNALHPADIVHPAMEDLLKKCCTFTIQTKTAAGPKHRNRTSPNNNSNNNHQSIMEGLQFAQDILDRCFVEKRRHQSTSELKLFVPQKLIQIVLFGWCQLASHEIVAQQRMKELLHLAIEEGKMDDQFLHTKCDVPRTPRISAEVYPTVNLFNTYLVGLSYAATIASQAALDAEALLYDMIEYNRTLGRHTKPNTRSYTNVINAYTNTKHVASGRRAYQILQRMKTVHEAEKEVYEQRYAPLLYNYTNKKENKYQIVTPDAIAYTATLNAIQSSKNRSHDIIMDLLNEAVAAPAVVLDPMLFVVTIKSLASVIDYETHALKRIELAKEAESILRTMIEYSTTKGFQNKNVNYYNKKSTKGTANNNDYENDPIFIDDDDGKDRNSDQVSSILDSSLLSVQHGQPEPSVPTIPDEDIDVNNDASRMSESNKKSLQIGYNACIYAWAQSFCKEGAPQCETLLNEMIESNIVQPDATTFNTCIFAWSKSHKFHPDAGQRAIQLLQRQFELSKEVGSDEMKPDFQTFTSCILVLSKSNDDDRLENAMSLLQKLLEEVKLGNLPVTRNPTAPFSAVLSTIANYKVPKEAASRNNDSAETEATSGDYDVFNSTINTQTDPYSIANNIFDQIEKDTHGIGTTVDHHCVTAFLKCVAAHSVPGSTEREYTSRRVFHDTCQSGFVSRSVLKEFQDILGPAANTFPDLRSPPKFWSRNVPNAFR